jgi:hypothetical protein
MLPVLICFYKLFYLKEVKFRYLYAHAEFSIADLQPRGQTTVSNFPDVVNEQVKDKKLYQSNSFLFSRIALTILDFSIKKRFFEVLQYANWLVCLFPIILHQVGCPCWLYNCTPWFKFLHYWLYIQHWSVINSIKVFYGNTSFSMC